MEVCSKSEESIDAGSNRKDHDGSAGTCRKEHSVVWWGIGRFCIGENERQLLGHTREFDGQPMPHNAPCAITSGQPFRLDNLDSAVGLFEIALNTVRPQAHIGTFKIPFNFYSQPSKILQEQLFSVALRKNNGGRVRRLEAVAQMDLGDPMARIDHHHFSDW